METVLIGSAPTVFDAPWEIRHGNHLAWYERSAIVGDFRQGLPPRPEYVVHSDERVPDLGAPPVCEGCGQVPMVEDLLLVERVTGRADFLRPYRTGRRRWPEPTNPETCAWCNTTGIPLVRDSYIKLCVFCEASLSGKAPTPPVTFFGGKRNLVLRY